MTVLAPSSPVAIHNRPIRHLRPSSRSVLRPVTNPAYRPGQTSYTPPSDSSDEEDLAPIKLSAEAQAILDQENSQAQNGRQDFDLKKDAVMLRENSHVADVQSQSFRDGSPAPRVVRIPGSRRPIPPTQLERDGSFAYKIHDKSQSYHGIYSDMRTPASYRRIRVSGSRTETKSPRPVSVEAAEDMDVDRSQSPQTLQESESHHNSSVEAPQTTARNRRTKEIHSTIRTGKIGRGTLLNGPVRRGVIRRYSEDEAGDAPEHEARQESPEIQHGRKSGQDLDDHESDLLIDYRSPPRQQSPHHVLKDAGNVKASSPVLKPVSISVSPVASVPFSASVGRLHTELLSRGTHNSNSIRGSSSKRPVFRVPALQHAAVAQDENIEPPPTFKRVRPTSNQMENLQAKTSDPKPVLGLAARISPQRQALGERHENTPHRPAPAPPPRMSLIEAATSNAGNSRAKKSVHYVLNGRTYRRLDCIGRGGSSRVFRIMAENYKIFALKRVNLEEADMAAIAGYKGEIELLKRLENVERVIRLFDYEVNDEKGILNVIMELGETDFNKMLNDELKGESLKLDITFTRHYWKEMLECVQAVHEHDVVHSDLKPANFLLVKGQLKLIDFGIANAIQDNTVNVHRENQIGTPNYMSPESLVCHTPMAGQAAGTKLLKLGKPSDVWSLGCILYQMTYGQPPFAHIQKQFERIMSIPNPKVEIQFPSTGIGGSVVPFGLIKTLKRCLQRDQTLRPTVKELLSDSDPFLNPVAISPDMLGRVIGNVVSYCRKREDAYRQSGQLGQDGISCLPREEDMRGWPQAFYNKLRQAQEDGTAW